MRVVAHTALFEPDRIVSMDLGEVITLMTIETAAFEDKTATAVQTVALGTLYTRNRRMLVKRLKRRWRIRTNEEMHFLFAAFPEEDQRVQARRRVQCGMKHIGKGLIGLDEDAIQLEFSRWSCGNDVDLAGCVG